MLCASRNIRLTLVPFRYSKVSVERPVSSDIPAPSFSGRNPPRMGDLRGSLTLLSILPTETSRGMRHCTALSDVRQTRPSASLRRCTRTLSLILGFAGQLLTLRRFI